MTSPARKRAPAPPVRPEDVHLPDWLRAFARREGALARLARESGRGNAHFGLDAAGDVVRTDVVEGKYADHASYPMSRVCPACGDAGNPDPKASESAPGGALGPCRNPACGHAAFTFPGRSP